MVSKSYGWTDEIIHDLTLMRLRQIVASIIEDQQVERIYHEDWLIWQTQTIAEYVAATAPSEEDSEESLLSQAQSIAKKLFEDSDETTSNHGKPIESKESKPVIDTRKLDAPPPMSAEDLEKIADKNGPAGAFRFHQVLRGKGATDR